MANNPAGPDQPTHVARPKSTRLALVAKREVASQASGPEEAVLEAAPAEQSASGEGEGAPRREVVSQKELARLYRRQAYQRAKAYRAADPKYAQLKEVAKLRRRELYQQIKQTRKAAALVDKSANKAARAAQRAEERAEERAAKRRELRSGLKSAEGTSVEETGERSPGASEQRSGQVQQSGRALQSEIQAALQNKRVSALLARVRLAGEQPDVIANEECSSAEVVPLSRSRRAKEGSPG